VLAAVLHGKKKVCAAIWKTIFNRGGTYVRYPVHLYIGLEVYKDKIAVAFAREAQTGDVRSCGSIASHHTADARRGLWPRTYSRELQQACASTMVEIGGLPSFKGRNSVQ
jgi:hypothetical protein